MSTNAYCGTNLAVRVIPCLDVDGGRVVKGVNFENLRDAGDPVELAAAYDAEGADELTFLDVTASSSGRATMLEVVRRTAEQVFIPLTVGGGIRSIEDMRRLLLAGTDKCSINSAALARPELVREAAQKFVDGFRSRADFNFIPLDYLTMFRMLTAAINKAGSTDPLKVALALEDMHYKDLDGQETIMRKEDHQLLMPYYAGVFSKDVKYDAEHTGFGWKNIMTATAADLTLPTICKMKRPEN